MPSGGCRESLQLINFLPSSTEDGAVQSDAAYPRRKRNRKRKCKHYHQQPDLTLGIEESASVIFVNKYFCCIKALKMPDLAVEKVVVHPLVLLSVVDHFNR